MRRFGCENVMVIPGNHDSRNVGYVHFERLFGERYSCIDFADAVMVGVDSSEPDLNDGRVGREHYGFIQESFAGAEDRLKIFVIHHHLIPIPGTGRERNIIFDAGDVLELLNDLEVDLVLSGHKHVPYSWKLEDMFIVNAGTASTTRLRGNTRPCYNIIEIEDGQRQGLPQVPLQGAGADHGLRLGDPRVLALRGAGSTRRLEVDPEVPLAASKARRVAGALPDRRRALPARRYSTRWRACEKTLGAEGVAAAFLGGTEKLKEGTDYGVPLVKGDGPGLGGAQGPVGDTRLTWSWTSPTSRWSVTGSGCG